MFDLRRVALTALGPRFPTCKNGGDDVAPLPDGLTVGLGSGSGARALGGV